MKLMERNPGEGRERDRNTKSIKQSKKDIILLIICIYDSGSARRAERTCLLLLRT
jgi:hypothetical protein